MGAYYEQIPESLIEWILKQKLLFVATAPLHGDGHVNVSPKGGDSGEYFGVIDQRTFWYHELTGSGSETVSHLYEPGNGRITIMFTAFEGPPRILRLYGRGQCLENGSAEFQSFVTRHAVQVMPGTRSIIIVDIHQVGTSCGFSVPYYDFKEHRPILDDFFKKKQEKFEAGNEQESMPRYWAFKNAWSVDGLPSYNIAQKTAKSDSVAPIKKFVGALAEPCYRSNTKNAFTLPQVVLIAALSALLSVILVTQLPRLSAALPNNVLFSA